MVAGAGSELPNGGEQPAKARKSRRFRRRFLEVYDIAVAIPAVVAGAIFAAAVWCWNKSPRWLWVPAAILVAALSMTAFLILMLGPPG